MSIAIPIHTLDVEHTFVCEICVFSWRIPQTSFKVGIYLRLRLRFHSAMQEQNPFQDFKDYHSVRRIGVLPFKLSGTNIFEPPLLQIHAWWVMSLDFCRLASAHKQQFANTYFCDSCQISLYYGVQQHPPFRRWCRHQLPESMLG